MLINVTSPVTVELREEVFTEQFMGEFRDSFYPFFNALEHAEHFAQLAARELISEVNGSQGADQFVEGYGPIGQYVSKLTIGDLEIEEG